MSSADWAVIVSAHALERAGERFEGVPLQRMVDLIVRDVYEALRAGRKATRWPRFMSPAGPRSRVNLIGFVRVVWTGDEERVYVLSRTRDTRGKAWVVVTCLTATGSRWRKLHAAA